MVEHPIIFFFIFYFMFLRQIFKLKLPLPHSFATKPLESNMEILDIVTELGRILSQLSGFINQFNQEIITENINVITDAQGNLSIEIPADMTESKGKLVSARIKLLDTLIHNHVDKSESLLHYGISVEEKLFDNTPNYETQLTKHVSEFKRIKGLYRHF